MGSDGLDHSRRKTNSSELTAEATVVFFAKCAVELDGSGNVLAAEQRKRITVIAQPLDRREHEPVEHGATDQRGGRTGHRAVFHFDDRVAGHTTVVQHMIPALEETFATGMLGGDGFGHGETGERDHDHALLFAVERDFDRRGIFAGIGNRDQNFAGEKTMLAIVTFDEFGAVAHEVFDETVRRILNPADADQPAGATDNLARNQFTVTTAEGVDDAAVRDTLADDGSELLDHRCVGRPSGGEKFVGALVVAGSEW